MDAGDGCRNKSDGSAGRSRKVVKPHTWPAVAKIAKADRGEKEPTLGITFGAGHLTTQANTRNRRGVSSPQALMRHMPPSSTGVRLVEPFRSCSVAGSDKRGRKSALPFELLLRYSSV